MRKTAIFILTMLAFTACNQQETFTIEGTVEGAKDSMLYFENAAMKGLQTLDSTKLGDDGKFCFHGPRPEAPEFYVLRIGNQIINISIDSTETVSLKAQMPNMASNYEVTGSENCTKIRELALMQQELHRQATAIYNNRQLPPSEAQQALQQLVDNYKQRVKNDYIFRGPDKAYAYFALFQTLGRWLIFNPNASPDDIKVYAAVATSWDTFYPNAERTRNLHEAVIKDITDRNLANALQQQQIDRNIIVEAGVIDMSLNDNHGQTRTLTELKGQVVLLDFHSFQLKDSPQRILMLRDLYNKYHDRGLQIYQVSLDGDEHFWRQMTRELPWISVRDASGESARSYNVKEIPEYFLIDAQNQLQQRGSDVTDMEAAVKALLPFRP